VQACVSLWSADLLALGAAIDSIDHVADSYHIDVFDGHDVPELLFGPDLVASVRARTSRPIDVHLNVTDPDYWAQRFIDVGADIVSVQTGASADIRATMEAIRGLGAQPSLGLEVHEDVAHAESLFDSIDRVLLMGTQIGIKGVDLDPAAPERVRALCAARRRHARTSVDLPIVVDGGIRAHTVAGLAASGADGVVPGSLVFAADNPAAAIERLHGLISGTPACRC
jgi:ribulose-phosphate 3-epimerase